MSCFRVTHVDVHHRRRRIAVRNVANRLAAVAWVEQLYGTPRVCAAIRLTPRATHTTH